MSYGLNDAFTISLPVRNKSSSRRGNDVRLGIFHTAEGARTVQSLASWFNNPSARASSHAGADDNHLSRMVPESQSAWTASKANPHATQIELCGFARWSASEWRSHAGMLEHAARWAAAVSVYHNIPLVRLKPSQVRSGRGFCMHHDITVGWPTGSHTDCGSAFRDHIFDGVLARARAIVAAGSHAGNAVAPIPNTPKGFLMALSDAEQAEVLQKVRAIPTAAQIDERINGALDSVRAVQADHTGKLDAIFATGRVTDDRVNKGQRAVRAIVTESVAGLDLPAATVDTLVARLSGTVAL